MVTEPGVQVPASPQVCPWARACLLPLLALSIWEVNNRARLATHFRENETSSQMWGGWHGVTPGHR